MPPPTIAQHHAVLVAALAPLADHPPWLLDHLIAQGKALPPFPLHQRQPCYQVYGCMAQVWLVPQWCRGRLYLQAESNAAITKGLAALLVALFENTTPHDILAWDANILHTLGLSTLIGAQRTSGTDAMVRKVKTYAQAVLS